MNVEMGSGFAGLGKRRQLTLVSGGRGLDVASELAVAGRHRMHVVGRDFDAVEQRGPGLLLVALVVVGRNEAVIAPEQVDLGPLDAFAVFTDLRQQPEAGS